MVELGGDLDFTQEAIWAKRHGQLRPQHFDGHLTVVLEVVR
jgi:hypothetical protein